MKSGSVAAGVDQYIAGFPKETQKLLSQLRATIRKAAPEAEEGISYQMPAYKYRGPLVYFAGYARHIGLYPTPSAIEAFKKDLSDYKTSKGAVQFPLDKPLPVQLITRIVNYRKKENLEKEMIRAKKKK
jgi:uncharacterized protein YdhG (YjbR/CyaY superfamily)